MEGEDMNVAIWVAIIGGLSSILTLFYKNWNEARRVNIPIPAELQRLISVIEEHKSFWEKCVSARNTGFPLIPFSTPVFDQHRKNLGRIDSDVVAEAVKFYGYLRFINSLQAERPNYTSGGKSKDFDQQYLKVLNRILTDFKGKFDDVFRRYGLFRQVFDPAPDNPALEQIPLTRRG
jgi:hypothetical protein